MTVKVRVQDFQSIKDATLDIQGLTVITGPNNSGKSAFMRAIRGAAQNTRGNAFVRRGAAKSKVDLTFDDGHTLTWEKGAKVKPTFTVDGGPPIHPGQGVPDEVRALGIRPIKAGGEDIWPQIAPQFHQVFLIDQPGSVLAEAVADVERVGQLHAALKSARSDQTRAASTLQVRQGDVKSRAEELATFEGLDQVVAEIKTIEADTLRAGKIQRAVEGLGALRDRLHDAEALVESLAGAELIDLPPESAVTKPQKLLGERDVLSAIKGRLDTAKASETYWAPLSGVSVPSHEAVSTLQQGLDDLGEMRRLESRHTAAKAAASKWSPLEGVTLDADEASASKVLSALGVIIGLERRLEDALGRCTDLESRVVEAGGEAAQAEKDFQDLLEEFGECPVCGGSTEAHEC